MCVCNLRYSSLTVSPRNFKARDAKVKVPNNRTVARLDLNFPLESSKLQGLRPLFHTFENIP